ncbi:GatB/YqeY domain-containing protein [Lactobacillus curvatus]|uniref:GatB/YqeY domain-containing protein n=1 Tax=Latilactobacillus fragifolii TaxID=2814244 RepID=UPI0012B0295E|nr:GatB/YqeY domain-containing protein [Latilactobacillus fragifolii]MSD83062.1 GatB/YqeY domain-containing protein [Latilactobacillus curvatus]MSE23159.1 GatB/YqeY domain-containing protein [Latilactobacillus curvatus]
MSLLEQLSSDLKTAMKAKDKLRLAVIRSLKTALTNAKISAGQDLSSDEELSVLSSQLKQRKDSLAEFEKGDRSDLAEQTKAEIEIVQAYLPEQLDEAAVITIVDEAMQATGATSKADFGKVMQYVMPKVKGRADGAMVNQVVKSKLS